MRVLVGRDGILQLARRSQHTSAVARLVVAFNQIPKKEKDEDIITITVIILVINGVCVQSERRQKVINNDSEGITTERGGGNQPTKYKLIDVITHLSRFYKTF